jgi:hypothetical protein
MRQQVKLHDLANYIESNNFLLVGSPKGVGFSTYMAEHVAYKLFFEEDFFALILTDSRRDKLDFGFKIKKAFAYYEYPLQHDIEDGIHHLYIKGNEGGGICIMNYNEFSLEKIVAPYVEDKVDLLVIDKDDFSDYLYSYVNNMQEISHHLVFNTYEVPHSLFYNLTDKDAKKIVLTSKYSKDNIEKNFGRYPNRINYDRILLGEFK